MGSISRFITFCTLTTAVATSAFGERFITDVGSGTPDDSVNGIYGAVFSSTTSLTIRSVGFYDHGGDGLAVAHRIGIGSGSGADSWPFFQTTIAAGADAPLIGGFRWVDLTTPVELVAGTYYTIAGEMIAGADAMLTNDSTDFAMGSLVTEYAARHASIGASWASNPATQPGSGMFILVNFSDEQLGSVPEPSAFAAIAGLAACGFVATRRRRSLG